MDSKVNRGSRFEIKLPINRELIEPKSDVEKKIGTQIKSVENKPKILIAEDNPTIQEYLVDFLSEQYYITVKSDGRQALQTAIDQIPDLIISDVKMPHMSGTELVKEIRKNDLVSHIPIILLSARTETQDRIQGYQHGANSYMAKPFKEAELLVQINNLLEQQVRMKKAFQQGNTDLLPELGHDVFNEEPAPYL